MELINVVETEGIINTQNISGAVANPQSPKSTQAIIGDLVTILSLWVSANL